MNLSYTPNLAFASRRGGCGVAEQIAHQGLRMSPSVEPIAEGAEVLAGVLAELEGLVGAAAYGLEVTQPAADPYELRHFAWLTFAHHNVGMREARVDYPGKASQAVAARIASRGQIRARPRSDCLKGEARDPAQLDGHRMALVIGGHRLHDGHVVGRAATAHSRTFASEVGVIDLDQPRQRLLAISQRHGLNQLLVDMPGRALAFAQLAIERQGQQPSLSLADQEDRQEPRAQLQFGAVHQRAGRQRGLMPATPALEELACPVVDHVVLGRSTARAAKTLRPTQGYKCRSTLRFGALALGFGHAALELDLVHRHRWLPKVDGVKLRRPLAHWMGSAEVRDELGGSKHV